MTNRDLLDRFKEAHGLAYDLDIAFVFGLSKGQLSDWVHDRRPIPTQVKFRLLTLIGYPRAEEFASLFVDAGEHARAVESDRASIAKLKGMAERASELAHQETMAATAAKKKRQTK